MTDLSMSALAMLDYLSSYKHGVLYAAATGTGQQAALLTDLNRGYQRFIRGGYYDDFNRIKVHKWSFLNLSTTIAMADGDGDYSLLATFAGIIDSPTFAYDADEKPEILIRTTPEQIRFMWAEDNTEDRPNYYAIEPLPTYTAATGQRWQMLVAQIPDATYTVNVRYTVLADTITASASVYPVGGAQFSDVIIQSSLAVIERNTTGVGAMEQQYQTLMKEAVAIDSATTGKATVENRYNRFPRHRMI